MHIVEVPFLCLLVPFFPTLFLKKVASPSHDRLFFVSKMQKTQKMDIKGKEFQHIDSTKKN